VVKYFLVLQPYPASGLAVLVTVTAFGVALVGVSPGELDSGLGLVLVIQMFLASSGFVVTARRGQFDPILTRNSSRTAALAAHWCASIVPGALAWLVLVAAGYVVGSPATWSAIGGSRLDAFVIVSIVAWCAGFALPRGAAGALWIGVLVFLLSRHSDLLVQTLSPGSAASILRTGGTLVLCPFLLLGTRDQIGPEPIALATAAVMSVLLAIWRVGARLDVYLVEPS
jgi:hypothetical protein